jgi:hypothetical protein
MYDRMRKIKLAAERDAYKRAVQKHEIFVAGPYIDRDKDAAAEENSSSSSKKIRYAVMRHYEDAGHNIYLGEDVELQKLGEKHYGKLSNAAFYERHYIKTDIDALIVFPDGPGVFCEFGDWSTTPSTAEKMLVIINKIYEGKTSYINDGTAKAAAHHGASIAYEDYDQRDAIIKRCDEFLDIVAGKARVEQLFER